MVGWTISARVATRSCAIFVPILHDGMHPDHSPYEPYQYPCAQYCRCTLAQFFLSPHSTALPCMLFIDDVSHHLAGIVIILSLMTVSTNNMGKGCAHTCALNRLLSGVVEGGQSLRGGGGFLFCAIATQKTNALAD